MLTEIAVFTYMLAKRKPRDIRNAILPTRIAKTNCSLWIFKAIWWKCTSEFVQGNYFAVEPTSDIVSLQFIYTPRHVQYLSRDVHFIHCMSLTHPTPHKKMPFKCAVFLVFVLCSFYYFGRCLKQKRKHLPSTNNAFGSDLMRGGPITPSAYLVASLI